MYVRRRQVRRDRRTLSSTSRQPRRKREEADAEARGNREGPNQRMNERGADMMSDRYRKAANCDARGSTENSRNERR